MIGLSQMGANALAVQHGHHISRCHAVDIERDKPFAGRIVGAANNLDTRHAGKTGQVAGAMDHRIGQ